MPALESFVELYESTPNSVINDRLEAAWTDPQAMLGRIDRAAKDAQLAYAADAVGDLPFRKREGNDAIATLSGAWFNGYLFVRGVHGTTLAAFRYSNTDADVSVNAQRLFDFAEGIDHVAIYEQLPKIVEGYRSGAVSAPGSRGVVRRLGARTAEAMLLTCWAQGIAMGIGEHDMFFPE